MNADERSQPNLLLIGCVLALVIVAGIGALWFSHAFRPSDAELKPAPIRADLPPATTTPATPSPDAQTETQLASALAQQNRTDDALSHYREAVRLYHEEVGHTPDSAERLNNLAWLLAANPFPEIRNGKEAVSLARRACELTAWHNPTLIGTLGSAYAEAGNFDEAIKTAQQARVVALANTMPDIASRNEKLITLYQSHQPYHEPY